jgi:hypothetical protein
MGCLAYQGDLILFAGDCVYGSIHNSGGGKISWGVISVMSDWE